MISVKQLDPDQALHFVVVVFVFNVPSTAKVIWRQGHCLKSHPTRLVKTGNEPAAPGLQGKQFTHNTMAAPPNILSDFISSQTVCKGF